MLGAPPSLLLRAIRQERKRPLAAKSLELAIELCALGAEDHFAHFLVLLEGILIELAIAVLARVQGLSDQDLLTLLKTNLLG